MINKERIGMPFGLMTDEEQEFLEGLRYCVYEVEVIYYADAIKYLAENDNSLRNSLELADECCFELKNINSETLATLLRQQEINEQISEIESDMEYLFDEYELDFEPGDIEWS